MQSRVPVNGSTQETHNSDDTFGVAPYKIALGQLFFTHMLVGSGVLVFAYFFLHQIMSVPFVLIGLLVFSGVLGVLLTANISYDLYRIENVLRNMLYEQQTAISAFPQTFSRLFTYLGRLSKRVQNAIRSEQAAAEIRSHYLQQASESATLTERQRISRDLHDSIKQQLFSISVSAAAAEAYWNKDGSRARLAVTDIQRVAREAQVEMQALLHQLSSPPFESTGLVNALRIQAEALKYRSGLELELNLNEIPAAELLPEGTQEEVFRIVQEAFSNIARHARAKKVSFTVRQTDRALHLIISDNGKGFDINGVNVGMGLANMRERVAALNGTLEVRSAIDQGTMLHIVIPFIRLEAQRNEEARIEQKFRQEMERATRSIQVGNTVLGIAGFLIGLGFWTQVPFIAVVVCLLLPVYQLLQGYVSRRKLIAQRGKADLEILVLRQKEEKLYSSFILICFVGGSFYISRINVWEQFPDLLFSILFFALCLVLAILLQWRSYSTRAGIYLSLSRDDIQAELTNQRRKVTRAFRILGTLVLLIVFSQGKLLLGIVQTSRDIWSVLFWVVLFLTIGAYVLFDVITLRQQQRTMAEKERQ